MLCEISPKCHSCMKGALNNASCRVLYKRRCQEQTLLPMRSKRICSTSSRVPGLYSYFSQPVQDEDPTVSTPGDNPESLGTPVSRCSRVGERMLRTAHFQF